MNDKLFMMRRLLLLSYIAALLAASETSQCVVYAISSPSTTSSIPLTSVKQQRGTTERRVTNAAAAEFGPRAAELLCARGGDVNSSITISEKPSPSIYWAVLHNWLYFVSLGFNLINIQFLVREIVDGDAKAAPSARSITLSGKIESVDKLLTFLGVGFLASLSDKFGRKPLMIWSSMGFALTNIIQATTKNSAAMLYLADFVDGCSSCMLPLCQAYIADVSKPEKLAGNLGIFQGLSAGGAFILAFPIGGLLGMKFGPRLPLLIAAGLQILNALILLLLTPESNQTKTKHLDLSEANPVGGLKKLFGHSPILRTAALAYFLASLARHSLDAQFTNYASLRFGWSQAQSGPVLVLVGMMLAVAPRLFISHFGLHNAILVGLLTFCLGLTFAGLAPTPAPFIFGVWTVAIGCMCLPALQAVLANLAKPGERGALLGAVGSVTELTGAIGSTMYALVLANFTGDGALLGGKYPGAHFFVAASLLLVGWSIAVHGFGQNTDHPSLKGGIKMDEI
jgi:DHA1 family tetracycline resistance protein-like MFS transporter